VDREEYMEDILLALLIFNVNNKGEWMDSDVVKLKVSSMNDEEFGKSIQFLKKKGYVETKDEKEISYMRATKKGINYLMERI